MEESNRKERVQTRTRILAGAVLGGALFFLIGALLNGISEGALMGKTDFFVPISTVLTGRTGSSATALLIEMVLYCILGALVGGASLPFAEERDKLLLRSACHFVVIAGIATLLTWLCDWNKGEVGFWLLLIGIIAAIYFIIWIGRWIGWNGEIRQIRDKLGIKKKQTFLNWRETIPYLLFLLIAAVILFLIGFGVHDII